MQHRYSALIVDSNAGIRGRLKNAMRAVPSFGEIQICSSLADARQRISQTPYDVVFISVRIGEEPTSRFILDAKQSMHGRDSAYVLVLEGRKNSFAVARSLMEGADGILLEPYSVHSLQEITALAERVRKERHHLRLKLAMRLLVTEIAAQLEQVSRFHKAKMPGGVSSARAAPDVLGAERSRPARSGAVLRGCARHLPAAAAEPGETRAALRHIPRCKRASAAALLDARAARRSLGARGVAWARSHTMAAVSRAISIFPPFKH